MRLNLTRIATGAALLLLSVSAASAGEKTLMHCFAWTPIKEATAADWQAFYQASDAIPKKIKGIVKVWYGKLDFPLGQAQLGDKIDKATFQKYRAGESVTVPVSRAAREYGMCMEMKDAATLKAYDTDPYHKIWTDAYAKIRVDGTTTFNILGQ
ncbi:MAG TPA: hypothetical protein VGV35_12430 [Bryobacteraceae bacterium]|nr:hypothetical protein [Bryobacteraceae bacterium]